MSRSGQVRWEGRASDQGSKSGSCQGRMSAVFQDFARYQMTLSDNVRVSDMACENGTRAVLRDTGLEWKLRPVIISGYFVIEEKHLESE